MRDLYIKEDRVYIIPDCSVSDAICINKLQHALSGNNTKITIDLSGFNIFTALHISALVCAGELIKDISKEIEIIVDNNVAYNYLKVFKLSNMKPILLLKQELTANIH